MFGVTAGWVAMAPLYIYVSGIIEVKMKESAPVFVLGSIATALVLYYIYDILAARTRLNLIKGS